MVNREEVLFLRSVAEDFLGKENLNSGRERIWLEGYKNGITATLSLLKMKNESKEDDYEQLKLFEEEI